MMDLDSIAHLLSERCFTEVAYFATLEALQRPSAEAHLLAGAACCGCAQALAVSQRLLEGAPLESDAETAGLRISPATDLPYEGFFHLIQALRIDPSIKTPENLRQVCDAVADDLAYVSRRELHTPPGKRKRYTLRLASVAAAILLRRLTESSRDLPGVMSPTLETAAEIIEAELSRTGGDAAFFAVAD